jgi:ABC-type multidrug transport system permease subunit
MGIVLGYSFQPGPLPPVPVAVVDGQGAPSLVAQLQRAPRLDVRVLDRAAADRELARGRVALIVHGEAEAPHLRADPTRAEAELARLLVERALRGPRADEGEPIAIEAETRPGSRYIDFLIPGLIGLNLLGAGMWGVGFNLVQMRTGKLLRRLFATPMRHSEFVCGYLAGRMLLVVPEAIAILAFGWLAFDVPCRGSFVAWMALVLAGAVAFAGLGCLLASRARSIEAVAGLINAAQLPMWALGGTFFANENLEGVIHWAAEAMPLTHLNRALRDVMLEPSTLFDVAWPLAGLFGFGLACFGVALRVFRWQ